MVNRHFFKPLLPDFHSHLTIPVAFFSKYVEGRSEHKTVKLRSDASKIAWEVKIEDGQKLTDGWKEFSLAHDLRVGDILIFRQEKDMKFHVTLMGPSCCEIQYESCEENNLGNVPRKKSPKREAESSSSLDPSCFLANVLPSTLRYDALNLPRSFVRANGLETRCGDILLVNEKGRSRTLALKQKKSGSTYIRRGWRSFCRDNGLKTGGLYTFKLIQRGRSLILRLSSTESESEDESSDRDEVESLSTEQETDEESNFEKIQRKKNAKTETEFSSLDSSCFVANISRATLCHDTLNLPVSFVRENGLQTRCGEIVLMNEKNQSWTLTLKRKRSCGTMYITGGWRSFCSANGLRAGSFFTFKLIQTGGTLVLRLSSQSHNQFLTLTLTPTNLKKYILRLPLRFTRRHGISEETKMSMLDKNGVKWSTDLRSEKTNDRLRLVGGWQEFFEANCVEVGESIIVKLMWEGDKSCVLKFCSKVKQETK